MEILNKGEELAMGKIAVVLAGLSAPRITVVSNSIEELQHYTVTYSAFWEMDSSIWRGGKLTGYAGGNEMDFNGVVWSNHEGKRKHVLDAKVDYRSDLYQRCLNEIIDATCEGASTNAVLTKLHVFLASTFLGELFVRLRYW
jgi:hypothetical protein